MEKIPPHIESMIRQLASEGLPVDQIAFMTRIGPKSVQAVLATPGLQAADRASARKAKRVTANPKAS